MCLCVFVDAVLQYMRPFGNLRILSMHGNQCSRDPDYHTRIIAHLCQRVDQPKVPHLSDLVYVDYKLVDPEHVQLAKEQWQDELYEEQEKETRRAEEAAKEAVAKARLKELQDANLEGVDTLLKEMLDDDLEQSRYQCVRVMGNNFGVCSLRVWYPRPFVLSSCIMRSLLSGD